MVEEKVFVQFMCSSIITWTEFGLWMHITVHTIVVDKCAQFAK